MLCKNCGKENPKENLFCNFCGSKIEQEEAEFQFNTEDIKYAENKNHIMENDTKFKNNRISNFIVLGIVILFTIGICLFKNQGGNAVQDTIKATNSTDVNSKKDEVKAQDQIQNVKISEQEATEKVKRISLNNDMVLKGKGIASNKETIGASELIGKYCYYFGGNGGNGIFYVVNSENGDVYECTAKSAGIMTLVHAQQKTNESNSTDASSSKAANNNTSTKSLKNTLLGHWISNDGENIWYDEKMLSEKNSKSRLETYTYWTVSDDSEVKNQILEPYKNKYIYSSHGQGTIDKTLYNFTDDIINNSIIIKSNLPDGNVYTELAVFSNDRKSYETYELNSNENSIFDFDTVYYFTDSKQQP